MNLRNHLWRRELCIKRGRNADRRVSSSDDANYARRRALLEYLAQGWSKQPGETTVDSRCQCAIRWAVTPVSPRNSESGRGDWIRTSEAAPSARGGITTTVG
jgi:hypothetical protein